VSEDKLAPYAQRHPEDVVLESSLIPCRGGFVVKWAVKNIGFGEFTFEIGEDGSLKIWNECMGPRFIQHVMNHLIDNAQLMEP
jgi:hypothetical protein